MKKHETRSPRRKARKTDEHLGPTARARKLAADLRLFVAAVASRMRTALTNKTDKALQLFASRRALPVGLIVAGIALLLYVGSQYGQMYMGQRQLAERWQEQEQHRDADSKGKTKDITDDSLIRLVIPKIDLTSFVVEGSDHHALLLGPGHMKDTAEPGEVGNAVISGHRDTFFRHVHELVKGDKIFVDRGGKRIVYEVTGKKIVSPDDVDVIKPTRDPELTLITCYPTYYIGPAPKRLIVSAKLTGEQPMMLDVDGAAQPRTHVQAVAATSTN